MWQESQVVPNLDDPYTQEQLAIKDASAEDKDAEKEKKKKKKKKKKTKKSKKTGNKYFWNCFNNLHF